MASIIATIWQPPVAREKLCIPRLIVSACWRFLGKIGHKQGATPHISLLWLWSQTDAKPWSPEAYVKDANLSAEKRLCKLDPLN